MLESETQINSGQANPLTLQADINNPETAAALDPLGSGSHTASTTLAGLQMLQWYGSRSQLWDSSAVADGSFLSLPADPLHEALDFGDPFRKRPPSAVVRGIYRACCSAIECYNLPGACVGR